LAVIALLLFTGSAPGQQQAYPASDHEGLPGAGPIRRYDWFKLNHTNTLNVTSSQTMKPHRTPREWCELRSEWEREYKDSRRKQCLVGVMSLVVCSIILICIVLVATSSERANPFRFGAGGELYGPAQYLPGTR
jgi:hypothetical protein